LWFLPEGDENGCKLEEGLFFFLFVLLIDSSGERECWKKREFEE